jgi:16S rRNA processing protein RimM
VSRSPHLELGYVSRAHGIRGEVAIKPFDPASEALDVVERLRLRAKDGTERTVQILSARPADKETLVLLEGVQDRSAAEALKGTTVLVFREDLPPPEEGEFFQADLVGLAAFDPAGKPLGVVEELWDTGPIPNLVIRGGEGGELVVPFADPFVSGVDLEGGRLTVDPPEWVD